MPEIQQSKPKRKNDMTTKLMYGIIAVLVIGILGVSTYILVDRLTNTEISDIESDGVEDFDGSIAIDPPVDMPDFTLTNQDGESTSLSDLRGKFVLLTFGYTHCPDVCPLTLSEFLRIRNTLGDLAENVEFMFISVDGKRDTPDVLKQYFEVRQLDGFIGLTGDDATLRQLGIDYGLVFEIGDSASQGGYLVSHTAGSFLLDRDGRWIMRYQFGTMPSMIVDDLKRFISTQ